MSEQLPVLKEVLVFTVEEIYPLQNDIIRILKRAVNLKAGFLESLTRRKLSSLDREFASLAARWVAITEKIVDPGKLISSDDPDLHAKMYRLLAKGELAILEQHHTRISNLMDYVEKILSTKRNEANFKVTVFVSIGAVLIAVGSLLAQAFS